MSLCRNVWELLYGVHSHNNSHHRKAQIKYSNLPKRHNKLRLLVTRALCSISSICGCCFSLQFFFSCFLVFVAVGHKFHFACFDHALSFLVEFFKFATRTKAICHFRSGSSDLCLRTESAFVIRCVHVAKQRRSHQ